MPHPSPPARHTRAAAARKSHVHRRRQPAALLAAAAAAVLVLLAGATPALAGLFGSSRGSSYRTSTSSYRPSSYKPASSSGYGYKPTYGGTPSFSAPKPGASAPFGSGGRAPPSNFGSSFLGGRPGAASYGTRPPAAAAAGVGGAAGAASSAFRPSRPSKATSLAVPLALGAGAGVLTSAAFRSGQTSCGDGRSQCYGSGCDQARKQCPGARESRLQRVSCPDPRFRECYAAGGGGEIFADGRLDPTESPAFLCMGPGRPRSPRDVVASCFDYSPGAAGGGGKKAQNGAAGAAAGAGAGAGGELTAEQLLSGDPALPSTQAIAASSAGALGRAGGFVGVAVAAGAAALVAMAA